MSSACVSEFGVAKSDEYHSNHFSKTDGTVSSTLGSTVLSMM